MSDTNEIGEEPEERGSPSEEGKQEVMEKKGDSSLFSDFMRLFEGESNLDAKIQLGIDFMRAALSHSGTPHFKDFWEAKRLCLPLFKQNISPQIRSQLWGAYIELSEEAKRLKAMLDEQSAFAIEQIELAIQALEKDLADYDLLLSTAQEVWFPADSFFLKEKRESYNGIQRELLLCNTQSTKINAMRKEIVKTEMRIRIKNKLLERLSACGDKIFPKRKELIKQVSRTFMEDVEKFIQTYFGDGEEQKVPLYVLREEIKQLQAFAKVLTLNTHAFTETRGKLSQCWEQIKNWEKERKKETLQKRQVFKENFDSVMEKIKLFSEACNAEISVEECNRQSSAILDFMRGVELGREEVRALRDAIQQVRSGPLDRARQVEQQRQEKEQEAEVQRREKINSLKEALSALLAQVATADIELLSAQGKEIYAQLQQCALAKAEKQIVDRSFKQLKDAIDDKKEKTLLMLSDDDLKALSQLKVVWEERKQRRQEIKAQLEHYRKLLGGSGFDFEKAMLYREMIDVEKATLEKINASINEIEEKIEQID